ncbi:unnamed protein product [Rotaria socialis]|nr:unnamed protein product [Rotaria socialis]
MVFILTILFVLVANVLLLNVLVALFNVTLEKYKEAAHRRWAYQQFLLVNEYSQKSPFPPPVCLIYYVYQLAKYVYDWCRNQKKDYIYGTTDSESKLSSNIYHSITFNGANQVKHDGTIDSISINFAILPSKSSTSPDHKDPEICLFIVEQAKTEINQNTFKIIESKPLQIDLARMKASESIQTFHNIGLTIKKDQYLAIKFSYEGGNPFTTPGDQYYSSFDKTEPIKKQPMKFTRCRTKGITMSFTVVEDKTIKNQNNRSKSTESSYVEQNLNTVNDNRMHATHIAKSYWKNVIECIKKEERDETEVLEAIETVHMHLGETLQKKDN